MIAKEVILKSMKRAEKERGLRVVRSNAGLAEGHMKKADHNLIVMTDLKKLGHEDWVVIAAYYSMYHAATALLAKIGLESKEHATTVAVLEHFFGEQINKELLVKFNNMKERAEKIEALTIRGKYIDILWRTKRARETVQYGISIGYSETNSVMKNARDFVSKAKVVMSEMGELFVEQAVKKANALKHEANRNE